MIVKVQNSINYPSVNIIEIREDSILSFDYNKLYKKGKIKIIDENTLELMDSLTVDFDFTGNDVMVQKSVNQVKLDYPVKFVRLLPTKDSYHLVDSLKLKTYQITFPNEKVLVKLGEKLPPDDAVIINHPPLAANHIDIEKFGETYFLCFYALEYRTYAFPIKEISSESIILYGFPEVENDIVAKRVD